jgi:hypothetical protein
VYTIEAAHNRDVAGSNPAPATEKAPETGAFFLPDQERIATRNSAAASRLRPAVDGHEVVELAADELFLSLVAPDLGLGCLVRRGDEADPLCLELGLAPLALPLLTLVLRLALACAKDTVACPDAR